MEKICILTFGCALNNADSESITAVLQERGFQIIDDKESADLIVINSCAVKGPTETAFFKLLDELKQENKKVVVAGCISQAMPEKLSEYSKIGPDQIDMIADIVDETLSGNVVNALVEERKNKLLIPTARKNPLLEVIPISSGCDSDCSYCITKLARGELYSYPMEDIVNRVRKAKNEGVKEIYLTSQDCGCWGFDIGKNLSDLLNEICKIEGDFMVRVGMSNPDHVLKILNPLIEAFKNKKIYRFLHIPVQAGNNFVLEDMKRGYTSEDYYLIVNKFKKEFPDITIATDIIVGYPTEKDEFFQDTIKLLKETKPNIVNLSKFWPRPKTEAAKLKQLPTETTKDRSLMVSTTFAWIAYQENKRWQNWKGKALATEKGKDGSTVLRNYAYKPIIVDKEVELGGRYDVEVFDVTKYDLRGRIV
ncbi:tRNA (N(6)-L-threonylcarbamoyladenosine(37)-C(2))-methylthiotransferase [Candidatus Woesearchaeota archaeon]|nr:tRNA (N(6)-L-threonylcarbamoyladenosine(37)-C(2))-methylthiotransferase [Candidatus Woesearchaeota archaeon]